MAKTRSKTRAEQSRAVATTTAAAAGPRRSSRLAGRRAPAPAPPRRRAPARRRRQPRRRQPRQSDDNDEDTLPLPSSQVPTQRYYPTSQQTPTSVFFPTTVVDEMTTSIDAGLASEGPIAIMEEEEEAYEVMRRVSRLDGGTEPLPTMPSVQTVSEVHQQGTIEYQREMDRVENIRNFDRTREHEAIRTAFRNLPLGYGLYPSNPNSGTSPFVLAGYTLREILVILRSIEQFEDGTPFDLNQIYFFGNCYDFHIGTTIVFTPAPPGSGETYIRGSGVRANRWSVRTRVISNVPLSNVLLPSEDSFWNTVDEENDLETFEDLLASYQRHIYAADNVGSDIALSTFVLASGIIFMRMKPFPESDSRNSLTIRTGSFEKILLEDLTYKLKNGGMVFVPGGVNRILFGLHNCVFHCLLWGLYEEGIRLVRSSQRGIVLNADDHEVLLNDCVSEVKQIQDAFYDEWFTERYRIWMERWSTKNEDGKLPTSGEHRKFSRTCKTTYEKMTRHGFSRKMMKKFVDFLAARDIMFLVHKREEDKFISTYLDEHHPFPRNDVLRVVSCFQIDLEGNFLEVANEREVPDMLDTPQPGDHLLLPNQTQGLQPPTPRTPPHLPLPSLASLWKKTSAYYNTENALDEFPKMFHCVALYPPVRNPCLEHFQGTDGGITFQEGFEKALRKANAAYLFDSNPENVHRLVSSCLSNVEMMKKIIKCQEERSKQAIEKKNSYGGGGGGKGDSDSVGGFDEEGNFIETGLSESSSNIQAYARSKKKDYYGAIVYDLETVENLRGCQEKVHPEFRKTPPASGSISLEMANQMYTVPESQIPYSVQFGFVNFEASATGEDILWDNDVNICYGLLGESVNLFMQRATVDAVRKRLNKVYCYAHNGAAFDTYLVMKFLTIPCATVSNILVTARGVLNLTVDVDVFHPVFNDLFNPADLTEFARKKVRFFFRDTRVFFSAKLSDLCKIFKVPAKYCKTDFPITAIHARNFDDPTIRASYHEYLCNDVYSLAFVVAGINRVIENDILPSQFKDIFAKDPQFHSTFFRSKPFGISQYLTLMSLATRIQNDIYKKALKEEACFHKCATVIDLPFIRNFITYANMGGRVLPFWRSFFSCHARDVLKSWVREGSDMDAAIAFRKQMYQRIVNDKAYGIVLDVTSLYPYAMSSYPMPTGNIRYVSKDLFERVCFELGCPTCHSRRSLCSIHADVVSSPLLSLGFIVFVCQFVTPPNYGASEKGNGAPPESIASRNIAFQNLCPRKLMKNGKGAGLQYDFRGQRNCEDMPFIQSFTHYDLYWMQKCGWKFQILFGIQFAVSYTYHEPLHDMFEKRKTAKAMENQLGLPKSLSTMWKNLYNGMYGINARKDINSQFIVVDKDANEANLRKNRKIGPDDIIVRDTNSHQMANGQWLLKLKKLDMMKETFASQSPVQLGAAVTSAARHHMNLLLYPMKNLDYGYTDTDSVFVTGEAYHTIAKECPHLLDDRADADMGTYKNDHEGGDQERVIASFLLAKKVKLHITLDAKGTIRFHDTFKGFRPNAIDYTTNLLRPESELIREKLEVLGNLFFQGTHEGNLHQTEFRRSCSSGITIDKHSVFTTSETTYFGHAEASVVFMNPRYCIELLIPHGYRDPDTPHDPSVRKYYEPFDGVISAGKGGEDTRYIFYDKDGMNSRGRKSFYMNTEFFKNIWELILQKIHEKSPSGEQVSFSENDQKWIQLFSNGPQLENKDFLW